MPRLITRRSALLCALPATSLVSPGLVAPAPGAPTWQPLFDGKSLDGWRATGQARWSIEDGHLVGRQGPQGEAGDIFTTAEWTDFEVRCVWRMKWPGNSGLWFRVAGPRTGYQADFLDQPSHPGVLSGSLYCMGKAFIAENRDAASVKKDGWNNLLVRAEGDRFRITLNGKPVIDVRDTAFPGPGALGFQIHAGNAFTGMEVRVREISLRTLAPARP